MSLSHVSYIVEGEGEMEIGWGEVLVVLLGLLLAVVLCRQYRREAKEATLVEEYCAGLARQETQAFLDVWRSYQTGSGEEYEAALERGGDRVEMAFQILLDDETWKRGPFSD